LASHAPETKALFDKSLEMILFQASAEILRSASPNQTLIGFLFGV